MPVSYGEWFFELESRWSIITELETKKIHEIADKLGITRQHYNRLENGKSNPSEKLYQKIEKEFKDVKNARELFNRS